MRVARRDARSKSHRTSYRRLAKLVKRKMEKTNTKISYNAMASLQSRAYWLTENNPP